MPSFKNFLENLQQNDLFKDWRRNHPLAYPSHFFCLINSDFQARASWEVGFYDPSNSKITVFVPLKSVNNQMEFEIKPEDDVFKEEHTEVEELTLINEKIGFEEAINIFFKNKDHLFANEKLHDGFVTLQTINKELLWNFTFISEKLKFLNLKISANTGELITHQVMDLIQK